MASHGKLSDDELLNCLKRDDQDAFTEVYNRYWKQLLNTAYGILHDSETAQDTVQNIFISLWQRRHEVEILNLKSYLHQAARFGVLKVVRAQQTDARFYERLRYATTEIIADNPVLFKEQQEVLKQLLDSMPDNCSEVFRLSREEGLTYRQIASQLNISEKTVEKRMSGSLSYLRKGLNWELCVAILLIAA